MATWDGDQNGDCKAVSCLHGSLEQCDATQANDAIVLMNTFENLRPDAESLTMLGGIA